MIRRRLRPFILGAAFVAGWSVPARAETTRVRTIRARETGSDTAVVIATSARPIFTTWKLDQPPRVVIELSGARLGDVDVPMDVGTFAVGVVTASVTDDDSAGPRTRIVLTLRQVSDYRVETKGNEITLRVSPRTRPPAVAQSIVETKSQKEARTKAEAQVRSSALETEHALAQAKADSEAKSVAELRARAEVQKRVAAQAESQAKTQALAQAQAESQAKTQALAQVQAELQAKEEALAKVSAEARARKQAQALAEEQTKLALQAKVEAAKRAEAQSRAEENEKSEVRAREAAQARAEERSRAEARAKAESATLRKELVRAHQEADEARAATAAAVAAADAARHDSQYQKQALGKSEAAMKLAQSELVRARERANLAERETAAARQRETERDLALRLAAEDVQAKREALDRISKSQKDQGSKLSAAARLVEDREATVRRNEAKVVERDEAARIARLRRDSLDRDASSKLKAEAAGAMAEAEHQRKLAAKDAQESRQELALAIASRKQEEARKEEQTRQRQAEEAKLAQAITLRKAEESHLAEARSERARLDEERSKLEQERARLEQERAPLLAEVKRLKAEAAAPPPVAAPIPPTSKMELPSSRKTSVSANAVVAKAAPPVKANLADVKTALPPDNGRAKPAASASNLAPPRSITLRALRHILSIDFVDEPTRASVIIDVDDSTTFTIERMAGRRLSLRLDHSELPENLERNLDATEYLGPVRVISSYRDPGARSTVRVDVDLAEDVPNHVRQDGNRIFWDFQKAETKAPSLPAIWVPSPSVLFVPARKLAGFVAFDADTLWTGQILPGMPGAPAPVALDPAPPAASAAQGSGAASAPTARYATLGKKRYVGRRIDLDFKGADIHNILRLLADVGQVNIVVADDVKGEVTIKMRDVPWDQALDVVLRSKALGSVREGNLLRVAPLSFLEKELEAEIARQKQIADVLPTETRLIGVSYADAGHLVDKARDLLTPRGKISVDTRTNNLIVSDIPKSLQLIEDLVRNLDTQTSQVVIEARIVEADSNYSRQMGIQWGGTAFADSTHGNPTGLVFPYNVGIGGGADDPASPLGGLVPGARTGSGTGSSPNYLVNMPVAAGLGTGSAIGLTLGSVAGAFNLNLRLSAMETTGQVRILSSPRITTMDNIEAHIEQGVSIPVQVVSAAGANTQFVDAKLHLSVKPHVTNEGTIALVILVTRNEPDFTTTGAKGDPTIQKKEAKTTMLVRDGDTAVIGGIYTRNTGLSNSKVPFFADIPVVGWFFRNRKENDNRSEFIVFITPRIANRARALGQ